MITEKYLSDNEYIIYCDGYVIAHIINGQNVL